MAGRAATRHLRRRAALIAALALAAGCGGRAAQTATPSAERAASARPHAARAPEASACTSAPAHDQDTIAVVRVHGNERILLPDVCRAIDSRAGERFSAAKVAHDLRALWGMNDFDDLQVEREPSPEGGLALTYVVRERPVVGEVRIDGASAIPVRTLFSLVHLRRGSLADATSAHEAGAAIHDLYFDEGFRTVKVDTALVPVRAGLVDVRYTVAEGPRATIASWTFSGNSALTDKDLLALCDTSGGVDVVGGVYRQDRADRDLLVINAAYYDRGMLEARVGPLAIEQSADGAKLAITIPIKEGPVYKLGALRFEGDLVADQATYAKLFGLKAGDVFRRDAAIAGIDKIKALHVSKGLHGDITPETELHPDKATVDFVVKIVKSSQ